MRILNKAQQKAIKDRQDKVSQMLRDGKVYREMAAELKCAIGTIKNDVDVIIQEWRETVAATYNEHVIAELIRLLEIDNQAAEQWELSKGRKQTKVKRTPSGADKDGKVVFTETVEVKTLLPEAKYLDVRTNISNQIRKLLGTDKPIKVAHTDAGGDGPTEIIVTIVSDDEPNKS